ncbi:PGPGW domain-containing protein [Microlunatus sp. Gsoil 973]|uniref:PGPGW domain-containing protein n=1 Tax=Microlunatus sp. Gsoil 973 TaxID=2672569 RepID=UPI0012B47605|nr:PGPGW domain-containing protein [Microlunatus sp. Gsoil 973]QGN32471.1 hypothetical protein GJV80_06275 [Microlunatus sp. Gsoil 973]
MATRDAPSRRVQNDRRADVDLELTSNREAGDDPGARRDTGGRRAPGHHRVRQPGDVPILLDGTDDRWAWRRKIRADPRKARIYRVLIAVLGVLLVLLGAATGPLPGPGGIPLVLLGLAVWASEFEWAQRLMSWFKRLLHRFRSWSRPKQLSAWLIFFACLGAIGYADLLVLGVPLWMPQALADGLGRLPGVS